MAEFYINLFEQEDYAGTNRPHYKALFKIDGVDHECAFWPNKDGKKGFSGKVKPKQAKPISSLIDEVKKQFPGADVTIEPIPF